MGRMSEETAKAAAAEAARTVPPREHGGNCDIKNLSRGSKVYFPVYVKGGGLSMGDIHFSQGDGEITFCGAIEMAGYLDIRVNLIKGGVAKYGVTNPIFEPSPIQPDYKRHLIFEGISVDEDGKQYYLDAHVAYRRACLNAIEYLKKFGYTGEQGYAILGTAPVEGRISGIVDIPATQQKKARTRNIRRGGQAAGPGCLGIKPKKPISEKGLLMTRGGAHDRELLPMAECSVWAQHPGRRLAVVS
jgi:formamidase